MRKQLFRRLLSAVSASVMVFTSLGINNAFEERTGSRPYKAEAAVYTPANCPGHKFETKTVRESTCSKAGLQQTKCIYCDFVVSSKDLPLKDHRFNGSTFTITKKPTCTQPGTKVGKCSVCGADVTTVDIPATGHSYSAWSTTKNPTCTGCGEMKRKCSTCGYVDSKAEGAPLGHSPKDSVKVDSTCTETGIGVSICERCHEEIHTYTIPAKGHSFGSWYSSKEQSCTEYSEQSRKCGRCGYIETQRKDPPTGHSLIDYEDPAPTCTEDGKGISKCENCHQIIHTYTIPAKGHSMSAWNPTKSPACTESGEKSRKCSSCGYTETDVLPPLGHKFIYYVKEEPTCCKTGLKAEVCERCKKEISTEIIPKKDHCEYNTLDRVFMFYRCSGCGQAMPSTTDTWEEYLKRDKTVDFSALDEEKRILFTRVYLSLKGADPGKLNIAINMMSNGDMIDITDYEAFRNCMNKLSAFCGKANDINEIIPRFQYIGMLSNVIGGATLAADVYTLCNTNTAGFISASDRTTVILNTLSDIVSFIPLYGTVYSEVISNITAPINSLIDTILLSNADDIERMLSVEGFSPAYIRENYKDYTSLADPEFFNICREYIKNNTLRYKTDELAEEALNYLIYCRLNADIKAATGMTIKDIQKNFKNIKVTTAAVTTTTTTPIATPPTTTTTATTTTAKAVVPAPTPDQTTTTTKAAVTTTTTTSTATTSSASTTTTAATTTAAAATTESSSTELVQMIMLGDGITAKVYSDGNAYISGKGDMYDFEESPFEAPEKIGRVSFAGSISSIGDNTFAGMSSISSIVIPKTVGSIGEKAFDDCAKLADVGFEGSRDEWKNVEGTGNVPDNISFEAAPQKNESIAAVLTGDSNCDGQISKADGMLLARYIAGWEGITLDVDSADINKDGQISKADGMLLARYIAGWEGYDKYFA